MIDPGSLTTKERNEYVDRIMLDLDGLKNLGPEHFTLRTRLMNQTGREFLNEVEERRAKAFYLTAGGGK